jgi:fatty acid desaturase
VRATKLIIGSDLTYVVNPSHGFGRLAKIMRRRLAVFLRWVLIIALVILVLFLDNSAAFFPTIDYAPTAATGVALLITVILCLSVSFWAVFVDKEAERWEGVLVLVGLILGSLLFWFSYLVSKDNLDWMNRIQATAATINNESIVIDCLSAITVILGLAAIAAFGLILRRFRAFPGLQDRI